MKLIVKNILIWMVVVISFIYAMRTMAGGRDIEKNIELKKLYHHTNGVGTENAYIELANVVFYFSKKVVPSLLKKEILPSGWQRIELFFPHVSVANLEKVIQEVNRESELYKINIALVNNPSKGLLCVVDYNATLVNFSYEELLSIGMLPGIVFHFINNIVHNQLIKKMELKGVTALVRNDKIPCIVIDPGHGGTDIGAQDIFGRIYEKDICLSVATKIANQLEQKGCFALLTRSTDDDVSLSQRSAFANSTHADLCVSIHANAAPSLNASGIETFYYSNSFLKNIFAVDQSQNSDLFYFYKKNKENRSKQLALRIQSSLCQEIGFVINRGVKPAISNILLGLRMPCALVEIGFLTHKEEALLMSSDSYQNKLARAIVKGILTVL